jgi:heme exporter protein D
MLADPPSNGEYLAAAYVVTAVILVGYWVRLWRGARKSVSRKTQKREREQQRVSGEREGTR